MQDSDDHLNMTELFKKFDTIDKFHDAIKKEFVSSTHGILLEFYPEITMDETLSDLLKQYASHIINAAGSVVDKDKNYPEYRLNEELETMRALISKRNNTKSNQACFDKIHKTAKKYMTKVSPEIINLSANGFRLLEANASIHALSFDTEFKLYISQQND